MRPFHGGRSFAVLAACLLLFLALAGPVAARATKGQQLSADLDGTPIDLSEVGNWFCHDFDYPVIHCFSDRAQLEAPAEAARESLGVRSSSSGGLAAALTGMTYVTVYEYPSYQGSFMNMSADYPALSLIGWNDRISSFKVKNSLTGFFSVDWLYGGAQWSFCCNQEVSTLNAYDNTFSSVKRT